MMSDIVIGGVFNQREAVRVQKVRETLASTDKKGFNYEKMEMFRLRFYL